MWIGVISLFPEMFRIISNYGVIKRAISKQILNINIWNPRHYAYDRHNTVDQKPYGGGPGMLMMVKPLQEAIKKAKEVAGHDVKVIYLSPQGKQLNHSSIYKLSQNKKLILICGRYEGIDERIINLEVDEEWSIGNYILSGGEIPAMVLIDAMSRLIPGVLNTFNSVKEDSFFSGLLKYPNYTRPKKLNKICVPKILLSGNHAKIQRWRLKQSLGRTWLKKPQLLKKIKLTSEQKKLLIEFQQEFYTYAK